MGEQHISISELIQIQLFLGSITYLIGSVALFFLVWKIIIKKCKIVLILLFQLCISVILSFFIWQFWAINIDIMAFNFVNLPALFAETVTILVFFFVLKKERKHLMRKKNGKEE
jgi:pilus assembly protein TadC